MVKKLLQISVFLLLSTFSAKAQFKIDAELRPRFEYRDGYKTLLTNNKSPVFIINQRSRLNFGYTEDKYAIFISVQDARIWGENASKTDAASIDINEAWVLYNFNDKISMKLGRQPLSYDDKHLLGPNDWNNVGATHDVGILKFKTENLKIDLGGAYNNNSDKTAESDYPLDYYKYMGYLWVNKAFGKNLSVSLLNLADGYQKENVSDTIYSRFTSGFYANYANDSSWFAFNLSAYYQYGKSQEGSPISAYFFSISPELNISKKFKAIAAIDYFSGDDALDNDDEVNAFSNLYGDGHGLYGYMDYFTTIDKHTAKSGLADIYLRAQYKVTPNTNLEATIHRFSLTNTAIDSVSTPGTVIKAKKNLGTEIDFMVKHKVSNSVELRFGYSAMLAARSMEVLKGGDHSKYQHWGWMMFIFKPTLLKTEKNK